MPQFRMQCQIAADYIKNQVKGLLVPAKRRAAMRGQYVGGSVPMGYVVDYHKDSETYRKLIPYEPHANVIRWMFKRYRELDGKINQLARELLALPVLFPDFVGVDRIPFNRVRKVEGGYHTSLDSLCYMLTNTTYIGYCTVAGTVVSKNNHEAIVSEEDFFYAFNRLSDTSPDGEEQERMPTRPTRYRHLGTPPVDALLDGLVTGTKGTVYVQKGEKCYTEWIKTHGMTSNGWSMRVTTLDKIVTQRLIYRLKQDMKEEDARNDNLPPTPDNMLTRLQEVQAVKVQQTNGMEEQLLQIARRLRRLDTLINMDEEDVDVEKLKEWTREQKQLLQTQAELQKKLKQAEASQATAQETKTLLERARNNWNGLRFEKQKEFVNLVIDKIVGEEIAPHWLKLTIYWNAPYGVVDTGYIWRQDGSTNPWTDEENSILHTLYPTSEWGTILEQLSRRSIQGIMWQAKRKGIKREKRSVPTLASQICMEDVPVLEQLGLEYNQEWATKGHVEWKQGNYKFMGQYERTCQDSADRSFDY